MSAEGTLTISFERPLVEPVANHIVALVNETLEPFAAVVTECDLPVERVEEPRQFPAPEILDPTGTDGR